MGISGLGHKELDAELFCRFITDMNYIIEMALYLVQYDFLQMSETSLFLVLHVTKVFESLINTKTIIINITKIYQSYFTYALGN